jgi:hypothetical protein
VRAGAATAAQKLETALTSGDFTELRDLLSADVVLDANLQGGRIKVAGAAEVVGQLTSLYRREAGRAPPHAGGCQRHVGGVLG